MGDKKPVSSDICAKGCRVHFLRLGRSPYIQWNFNVYPVAVEIPITQHPGTMWVAGIGAPDTAMGEVDVLQHYDVPSCPPGGQVAKDHLEPGVGRPMIPTLSSIRHNPQMAGYALRYPPCQCARSWLG